MIDAPHVVAVLMPDGWHDIEPGTFTTGSYYCPITDNSLVPEHPVAPGVWFVLAGSGPIIIAPWSSVLAVKEDAA